VDPEKFNGKVCKKNKNSKISGGRTIQNEEMGPPANERGRSNYPSGTGAGSWTIGVVRYILKKFPPSQTDFLSQPIFSLNS